MPLSVVEYNLISNNRTDVRNEIINLFLLEEPGTGRGELCSQYHYVVDEYDGYQIILHRPATLNKGFDFTVNVNGFFFFKNRRYTHPSHNDIIDVLMDVTLTYSEEEYRKVMEQIHAVFNCEEPNFNEIRNIYFTDCDEIERPIAIIVLAIKWLFIEQDVTYWNWSGRMMLRNKLRDVGLA